MVEMYYCIFFCTNFTRYLCGIILLLTANSLIQDAALFLIMFKILYVVLHNVKAEYDIMEASHDIPR